MALMARARPAEDRVQRCTELVRDGGEQLVLRGVEGFGLLARLLLARQQQSPLVLQAPPLGDVARDLRGAHDVAGGVPDGRHRDRHVDEPPVLGATHGLEVIDPLAPPDAREHVVLFRPPILGNDQRDGAADGLRRRPAESPLGGGVPGCDDAVERLAHDDVVRRRHDGGEPRPG